MFDFSRFIFPDSISFQKKKFQKNVYFNRVQFLGKNTNFREVEFSEEVELVDFSDAKFFGTITDFTFGKFFSKKINFLEVEFKGENLFFNQAEFSKTSYVAFVAVEFLSKNITFDKAKFLGNALFRASIFDGEQISFSEAKFMGEFTDFELSFFFAKVNFYNSYFENIEGLFEILRGKPKFLRLKEVLLNTLKAKSSFINRIRYLYETLKYKITFISKIKYRVIDFRFILGEKLSTKYPVIKRMTQDAWFLADFKKQHKHIYRIWNWTSKCGQSFARWALFSLIIVFLFGAIYADYSCLSCLKWIDQGKILEKVNPILILDQPNISQKEKHSVKWRIKTGFTPYYFSIVTFTTLGFGDVIPANLAGEIWLTIEVIVGYIMLGGLISIFAVKFARRS